MAESYSIGELLNVDSKIPDWGNNITTMNESNHTGISFCDIVFYTMIFLSLIIGLIGLVGNSIVLWFLGFDMNRNAYSVYILNLAGADFLFMYFQIVYCLHFILEIFYSVPIGTFMFSFVVSNFAYLCGLSILSAISIERCLSVMWPIWYRCHRPRHTSTVICTLVWFLSLLLSILDWTVCGYLSGSLGPGWCQTLHFITTAWLIILFVVLLGFSLALVFTIFCGSRRIPVTRLYVTIVCTVLVFLFFGLPYGIYWFLLAWIENFDDFLSCYFLPLTRLLACFNSCANPIIYFFVGSIRHRRFQRNTLKLLLQRAMQDTPEEE